MFLAWCLNILNCKSCALKHQDQQLLSRMLSISMKPSQSWEADSCSPGHGIPAIKMEPKVRYHVQKSLLADSSICQIESILSNRISLMPTVFYYAWVSQAAPFQVFTLAVYMPFPHSRTCYKPYSCRPPSTDYPNNRVPGTNYEVRKY